MRPVYKIIFCSLGIGYCCLIAYGACYVRRKRILDDVLRACEDSDWEFIDRCIESRYDLTEIIDKILMAAIKDDNLKLVQYAVKRGANINYNHDNLNRIDNWTLLRSEIVNSTNVH